MLLLMCLLLQFGSYAARVSQQKLEREPVYNLDADQSVGFLNFQRIKAVHYSFINTS